MPDAIQLLNQDHRKVEELFAEFERTQSWGVCQRICDELELHTQLEEEIVHPSLAQVDSNLEREADKEHDDARQLITRVRRTGSNGPELASLMTELKTAIEHHVEEEESGAWPKLRDELGQTRLGELGTRIEVRKRDLLGATASTLSSVTTPTASGGRLLDLTKEELYEKAKQAGIEGRSSMTKSQLADALQRQG